VRILFLRGSVPPKSEHPEKLKYGFISECEDMWTQLFWMVTRNLGASGEVVYQGGTFHKDVDKIFSERWVPSIASYKPKIKPDVIIARGGFSYYDGLMKRMGSAFKVYYGAGERFYPTSDFTDYNLFFLDTPKQAEEVKVLQRQAKVAMLVKPAASLFVPRPADKKYDVCFMANGSQAAIKGHEVFLKSMAGSGLSVVNVGNVDERYVKMAEDLGVDVEWKGWHLRKHLPAILSSCKVGVVCSVTKDSCPRVIPEYLACGLPVVATEDVKFWREKYITEKTGVVVPREGILDGVKDVLGRLDSFSSRSYYDKELSLEVAADLVTRMIT